MVPMLCKIALMALGVGPGDEVITPGFTYIATAETVALLGAKPVYVDVYENTYNLNVELLEAAITAKTKQSFQCLCMDNVPIMMPSMPLRSNTISLSLKMVHKDAVPLTRAQIRQFDHHKLHQLFPSKPLGCYGDGGAIFTSDDELAKSFAKWLVMAKTAATTTSVWA